MSRTIYRLDLFSRLQAADNDDLPDGAWWGALEAEVEAFNWENKTNHDPHDAVMYYLQLNNKSEERGLV